jgi:hypothetical protein
MSQQIESNISILFSNRNRLTAFFRIFTIIPVAIFLGSFSYEMQRSSNSWTAAGGLLFAPAFLALVFRNKYPTYVYSFNLALLSLNTRVSAYAALLVDSYPSIEASESVDIIFPGISIEHPLNRWMPLVKWFLAIPLYIVGFIYAVYAALLTLFAWFSILFTGEYPAWCARPVAGTIAYWNRVVGYAVILVTDEYPSFSL